MSQPLSYPERGYLVLPLPRVLSTGRYHGDFDIYIGVVAGEPLFRHAGGELDFATEMAARTAIQARASDWIDDHPLK
jgi:hypothetical protein